MPLIHPTALVDPKAELAEDVQVGPYALVGPYVRVGMGTRIGPHTVTTGHTTIGANNQIYQFASIGDAPQDKKYAGESTLLEIGDGNTIRECCTINVGTVQDVGITRVGNNNWIMAYCHIAHDCVLGNETVLANDTNLGGHVTIGDYAVLGGFTGVHQFCRIGAHAITGVGSAVLQDVPPYVMVAGNPTQPRGINSEGLRRRGFNVETIAVIKNAYRTLYRSGLGLAEAREKISSQARGCAELGLLVEFLSVSGRGIIR